MSQSKNRLFIQTIPSVPLFGTNHIPTAILYQHGEDPLVGFEAEDLSKDPLDVNRDFKVDLGHFKPSGSNNPQRFNTAVGDKKSAVVLTRDFLRQVLIETSVFLGERKIERAAQIMIAEPVRMHAEENSEWLSNYRANIRDLLNGVRFEGSERVYCQEIQFLPEPFAVFQYYRYGVRHAAIQQRRKYCALVVDFGGGTFDLCVIETTHEGEISYGGKSSNAYGASSVAVGGYFVNRKLIEHLLQTHVLRKEDQKLFKRGIEKYQQFRDNKIALEDLEPTLKAFVLNFHRASFAVEKAKIKLCQNIQDWSLEASLNHVENVTLPESLFSERPKSVSKPLSASEFRGIFVDQIWKPRLKEAIHNCLKNASQPLKGQPINIVLLSGGSANIGWLETLIKEDFHADLSKADFLPLEDYQEVVSKGLAIECARKFYSESGTGDFESMIYNPLWLSLDIADTGTKKRSFSPITKELPDLAEQPGLLIDAATSLQKYINRPLEWRVKQSRGNKKRLRYYFLRSPLEQEITELEQIPTDARLNFEETRIDAPPKCIFDSDLKLRLNIREDGTATPTFVYHGGRTPQEEATKSGKPFFLDMTAVGTIRHVPRCAYIGLDFGTSNTSVSFVNHSTIRETEVRSMDASWVEVSEVSTDLPHVLAEPLQAYISETSNKDRAASFAREFIENVLWFALITTYVDYAQHTTISQGSVATRTFHEFRQNTSGPIWALIKSMFLDQLKGTLMISAKFKSPTFSASWAQLFKGPVFQTLDDIITLAARSKHGQADPAEVDWHHAIHILGNVVAEFCSATHFGVFEKIEEDAFSGEVYGDFRVATGKPPFTKRLRVKLASLVPVGQPWLLCERTKRAFSLIPFFMCKSAGHANDYQHGLFWLVDTYQKSKVISYKSLYRISPLVVDSTTPILKALIPEFDKHWERDCAAKSVQIFEVL